VVWSPFFAAVVFDRATVVSVGVFVGISLLDDDHNFEEPPRAQ
jgi:hypothetical protein